METGTLINQCKMISPIGKDGRVPDRAGIFDEPFVLITPDGKSYVYTVRRYLMDLYLADGLK